MEDYEIIRKLIKTSQFISREDADDLIQDSWVLFTLDTKLTHAKSIQKAMNALRYNKREKSRVIANIPLDNLEPSLFPLGKPRGKMELTCHVCAVSYTHLTLPTNREV